MIKVLITDGDGALELPSPSPETHAMVADLRARGVALTVATNGPDKPLVTKRFIDAGLPPPDLIVNPSDIGRKKPKPEFVTETAARLGVALNEVAYLGDDDRTDTFCAINAGVLPLVAAYSRDAKPREYGIRFRTPNALHRYLATFGMQGPPYFGWSYEGTCADTGLPIEAYALLNDHGPLKEVLRPVLKRGEVRAVRPGGLTVLDLLLMHFISQVYLSGLTQRIGCVTVYPSSTPGRVNVALSKIADYTRKAFNERYYPDLLLRHTQSKESKTLGDQRPIHPQFSTLMVNPGYGSQIVGQTVLVLDDFTTTGNSFEVARRMLIRAGAANVIGVAIAKFRSRHLRVQINREWDPFVPTNWGEGDVRRIEVTGAANEASDSYFQKVVWPAYRN